MGVTEGSLASVDASVEEEVSDALRFADESAMPDEALLHSLVLAPNTEGDHPPPLGSYPAEQHAGASVDADKVAVRHA
jgi:hypothetical protein